MTDFFDFIPEELLNPPHSPMLLDETRPIDPEEGITDDTDPWEGLKLTFPTLPSFDPDAFDLRVGDQVRLKETSQHRSVTWPAGTRGQITQLYDALPLALVQISDPPKRHRPWPLYEIGLALLELMPALAIQTATDTPRRSKNERPRNPSDRRSRVPALEYR